MVTKTLSDGVPKCELCGSEIYSDDPILSHDDKHKYCSEQCRATDSMIGMEDLIEDKKELE